jgi:integrase
LFDEQGQRIRGKEQKEIARRALARVRLSQGGLQDTLPVTPDEWIVARVCSEYLQYCKQGAANGTLSRGHRDGVDWVLNDLCKYCGALPVAQLKKGHIQKWIQDHTTWKSPATQRSAIAIVLAAFNYVQANHDLTNPLKGLKKPAPRPRLQSFTAEDEKVLLAATDDVFRDFLFAAIRTGLRPFCELARLTAENVETTPRGMMWRVYSTKTKKTRKIPVRRDVAALAARLIREAPCGTARPLFRNSRGTGWTKVAGVVRFLGIKKKLGWDNDATRRRFSCYTCRHTFAHRMLSGYYNGGTGCSIETLAELMGDTPKVAFDHYGKEWGQHYQDPLWAAIGEPNRSTRQGGSARR